MKKEKGEEGKEKEKEVATEKRLLKDSTEIVPLNSLKLRSSSETNLSHAGFATIAKSSCRFRNYGLKHGRGIH